MSRGKLLVYLLITSALVIIYQERRIMELEDKIKSHVDFKYSGKIDYANFRIDHFERELLRKADSAEIARVDSISAQYENKLVELQKQYKIVNWRYWKLAEKYDSLSQVMIEPVSLNEK